MMTMSDAMIEELTREAASTRRVLERIPEDRLSWSPHPKSMTLGQLALHIASIPGNVADFLSESPRERPDFAAIRPEAKSLAELISTHEASIAAARGSLAGWSSDDLAAEWTMVHGTKTLIAVPRTDMLRSIMFNHLYHHRGELLVYLRLLNVPVPAVYGASADENPFA